MYVPSQFMENDRARLHQLIRDNPFGQLVSTRDGEPFLTHVPFRLDSDADRLLGHLARANPHCDVLFEQNALAVFQGPHAYVSPRWYHTPNVPTWNFTAVHVSGRPEPLDDEQLEQLLWDLSAAFEPADDPWTPDRLAPEMMATLRKAIVGFALPMTRVEGKFKLSQNRRRPDREGAIKGLREAGENQLAELMTDALARDG